MYHQALLPYYRNHHQHGPHLLYESSMDILKTGSWFVKEVIKLDVYCLMLFTPYYEPSNHPWKVVANSMSSCL